MSDSVEVAIQRAAAGATATGPATPIVIKEDRSIVVPTAMQQIAVQCDNEANVLHFVCPRNWADIDLAAATLYINVVKPDKSTVAFVCTNVVSSEDTITFDWVVTEPVTDVVGKLSFLVCARDPSDPGNGYRWHSNLCDSLFIAPGIACVVPSDTPDPPHIPLYGTDTTLTKPHVPADAAAVGERLSTLSERITNLPQADWNQNDSTAADYVKNRPFYTGDPVETVVVEETTVPFAAGEGGLYIAQFPSTFVATVGETYKVSWDGTAYECICVAFGEEMVLGNLSIPGAGSDTGEPFVMAVLNGLGIFILTADTSDSHTFSIGKTVVPVVKIDKKYLVQPDWNQNDENAADFVRNRPFYSGTKIMTVKDVASVELERFPVFAVGDTVTVNVDGVEHSLVAYADDVYIVIGDTRSSISNGEGQLGWQISVVPEGQVWFVSKKAHVVSYLAHVDYAIDAKYLPDNLATKAEVEAVQTTASAAQTAARNAQTTANAAQSAANAAQSAAENAIGADVVKDDFKLRVGEKKYAGYGFAILHNDSVRMNYTDTGIYDEISGSRLYMAGQSVFRYSKTSNKHTVIETNADDTTGENSITLFTKDGGFTSLSADGELYSTAAALRFGIRGRGRILRYVNTPEEEYDAATKGYVDGKISDTEIILQSSTPGSTKKFRITVDDSGTISATEVV